MAIQRHVKRAGKLWIRIFPDRPVTKKPLEVRMGGGKGAPEEWAAAVRPGRVMYEISGVTEDVAREAFGSPVTSCRWRSSSWSGRGLRGEVEMKVKDLRERTTEHLGELEKQLAGEVFQARFKNYTNASTTRRASGRPGATSPA